MMAVVKESTRQEKRSGQAWHFFKRELTVLLIWGAILIGAINFLFIVDHYWTALPDNWWWLVIAVATLNLPKTFRKLRNSDKPILVRFAIAFREGFLSLPQVSSNLSEWQKQVATLWRHISRK